eukprot:scaffold35109_cov30-Prasinocladus_malaysianus.AAC.1
MTKSAKTCRICHLLALSIVIAAIGPALGLRYAHNVSVQPRLGRPVGSSEFTPIVLWHGLGDSCCNPDSIGAVQEAIEEQLP